MLTTQHIEEGLSRAYLSAIVFRAGMNMGKQESDYGVDGTIAKMLVGLDGRRFESGAKIDFQLKATTRWQRSGNEIVYPLEVKNYNDLVQRASEKQRLVPLILILLCLPQNENDWLTCNEDELILRKCCYWYAVKGNASTNAATVTVRIPTQQVLTPQSLVGLLEKVSKGKTL